MNRRRALAVLVVGGLVVGALTACGGDDDQGRADSTETTRAGTDRNDGTSGSGGKAEADAAAYVGLTKKAAIAKADAAGTPWRIVREDDESFIVTLDYEPERLNFEIDDGTITKSTLG